MNRLLLVGTVACVAGSAALPAAAQANCLPAMVGEARTDCMDTPTDWWGGMDNVLDPDVATGPVTLTWWSTAPTAAAVDLIPAVPPGLRPVRTLDAGTGSSGGTVIWNLGDEGGQSVPDGGYRLVLRASGQPAGSPMLDGWLIVGRHTFTFSGRDAAGHVAAPLTGSFTTPRAHTRH